MTATLRRMNRVPIPMLATIAVTSTFAGCGSDSSGPGPAPQPGIHVLNRPDNDTVQGTPVQALIVQVRGPAGDPAVGAVVRFEAPVLNGSDYGLFVSGLGAAGFGPLAVDTTDAQGQAAVRVSMGRIAGTTSLSINVPQHGFADTVTFTITPGAPNRVRFVTRDTAVAIGRTAALAARVHDRLNNPRAGDPVTYALLAGPATVSGNTATGTAFGRALVAARAGALADTMRLSVMPPGSIAAWSADASQKLNIYELELDGRGLRSMVSAGNIKSFIGDIALAWSTDRTKLFFHEAPAGLERKLWVFDIATGVRSRLIANAQQLEFEAYPRASSDGWVYFNGGDFSQQNAHRVRVDGSGLERLPMERSLDPSPSPDGMRVVFADEFAELQILNLATGAATPLGVTGLHPLWAPGGNEILYIATDDTFWRSGQMRAVRVDGTNDRPVTAEPLDVQGPFSFSPDGRYIVARGTETGLVVIEYATGQSANLVSAAFPASFNSPVWK